MNCKICNKVFTGIECFQQHEASEKHKKKLLQYNSSMSTESEGSFASASTPKIQNVNPTTFPCTTCAITFQTLSEFIEHTGSKDHSSASASKIQNVSTTTFPCTICAMTFQTLSEFIEHTGSEDHASASISRIQNVNTTTFPCTICAIAFHTLNEFIDHTGSKGHALRILQEKNTRLIVEDCDSTSNLKSETGLLLNNPKAMMSWQPRCEKCDKNFSGPEPYQQHINSFEHKRKCGLLPTVEMPVQVPLATYSSLSCETGMLLNNPKAMMSWQPRCEKCDKSFSGPEPYQQHINSFEHKRKCGLLPTVKMPVQVPLATYSSLSCETCRVTFTGPVSYQDHMHSMRHQKKVMASSNQSLPVNLTENVAMSELMDLKCEVCDEVFTEPLLHAKHLESLAHKEAAYKKYRLNKPTGKENDSDSVNVSDRELPRQTSCLVPSLAWYCEVCDVRCSGIDPYQAHVKGKLHNKKMLRKEAEFKQNELQNLLSGQTSSFASSIQALEQVVSRTEVDGRIRSENATTGDLGQDVKKSLYGEDWDVKTCTPSTLDLTFFAVGEVIDFNKNSKIEIEVKDLDMVDVKDEEMEE